MEEGNSKNSAVTESFVSSNIIKERSAEILEAPGKNVFYNPVQEFNRDLSVLALQVFSKKYHGRNRSDESQKSFRILEALSATGLRSIRYAKEVPNVTEVVANDYSDKAFMNIKMNIKHNNVEDIVKPSHLNAVELMSNSIQRTKRFDVVDLDPYGSPIQFLDTAVQCVADGGMLLVTCTDTGVLCGLYPETCYAKYGAISLKVHGKHEMAIRIVLQTIQSHASKYKRYIVPLLSVSVDFYIRIIVEIHTSAKTCKEAFSKLSMVYNCSGCGAYSLQPLGTVKKGEDGKVVKFSLPHIPEISGNCLHCGEAQQMGGPIWNGPIHDQNFVSELINSVGINEFGTSRRLLGMLTLIQEELHDVPLYYMSALLCRKIKIPEIPLITLRSAILNAGYRVSNSHAKRNSLKTDAPVSFLWDLFRAWAKENPANKNISSPSVENKILQTSIQNKIDFSKRADAHPTSRRLGLLRYQHNPAPNWGPGRKGTAKSLHEAEKREKKTENENLPHKKQKTGE